MRPSVTHDARCSSSSSLCVRIAITTALTAPALPALAPLPASPVVMPPTVIGLCCSSAISACLLIAATRASTFVASWIALRPSASVAPLATGDAEADPLSSAGEV